MTVRPGLDGVVKLGAWIPVEVQVANTGADVTGEIQIQVDGIENRGVFNRPPIIFSIQHAGRTSPAVEQAIRARGVPARSG
jgi:hypothetical protein